MNTDDPRTFGELLRNHRAAAGLTQEALAERAEMSVRGLSDLERGARRAPFPDTIRRLAAALGLPQTELDALLASGRPERSTLVVEQSADWRAPSLPVALTSFVDRESETAALRQLLLTTRLLTLTGPGGIGKTRLAIEVARVAADSSDSAVLVDMAPLTEPDRVSRAIASALGVREQPREPLQRTLSNAVGSNRLLLVLDNCEHVIASCAVLVDHLLRTCASLRILATSREPLAITGEVAWRVPSLPVPQTPLHDESPLDGAAAVRLFVDRASAAQPDFTLNRDTAAAVAEICQRLDGIPLALELAAARLPALGVVGVARRLDDRFRLLAHGARTAPARQRTLAAAIDWSYALLTERERAVLARLSVFARGFTLEAAETVCAAPDPAERIEPTEVLDLVSSLVDKSLVTVGAVTDGSPRYRLLETLRAYAADRLEERGDVIATRDRHAAYFVALAVRAEQALRGGDQAAWLDRLEQEHDDFRAALAWSLEHSQPALALQLGAALTRFWLVRGHLNEGATWLERALGHTSGVDAAARVGALIGAGVLAWHRGEYDQSNASLRQALALANAADDRSSAAVATYELAKVTSSRGDPVGARRLAVEALDQWQALGDRWGKAVTLNLLGELTREQGDLTAALALYAESCTQFQLVDDQRGVAIASHNLGIVATEQGDYRRAISLHREALPLKRDLGDREGMICTLINLAWLAWMTGDLPKAPRLCGAAEAGRASIGAVLPGYERTLHARTLELARSALGETRCDALEATGRAMNLEAALAEALED